MKSHKQQLGFTELNYQINADTRENFANLEHIGRHTWLLRKLEKCVEIMQRGTLLRVSLYSEHTAETSAVPERVGKQFLDVKSCRCLYKPQNSNYFKRNEKKINVYLAQYHHFMVMCSLLH
jgi:hypothetical protein